MKVRLTVIAFLALWVVIAADDLGTHDEKFIKNKQPNDEIGTLDIHETCPAVDPVEGTIHISHEYDCTKFYMCQNGEKIQKECPYMNTYGDKLHFNPILQVCDLPEKAGCGESEDKTYLPGCMVDYDLVTCDVAVDGYLIPHECTCKLYYTCENNFKMLRRCPPNLYFSLSHQQCVELRYANCRHLNCYHGDRRPHETECPLYYECVHNEWEILKCPNDLDFNKKTYECDDPKIVGCRHIPGCKDPSPRCDVCSPDVKDGEYWPHQCDCRLFYQCVHRRIILHQCPWGHYYDDIIKTCAIATMVSSCKNPSADTCPATLQ